MSEPKKKSEKMCFDFFTSRLKRKPRKITFAWIWPLKLQRRPTWRRQTFWSVFTWLWKPLHLMFSFTTKPIPWDLNYCDWKLQLAWLKEQLAFSNSGTVTGYYLTDFWCILSCYSIKFFIKCNIIFFRLFIIARYK